MGGGIAALALTQQCADLRSYKGVALVSGKAGLGVK